jgi:hypothetical protein
LEAFRAGAGSEREEPLLRTEPERLVLRGDRGCTFRFDRPTEHARVDGNTFTRRPAEEAVDRLARHLAAQSHSALSTTLTAFTKSPARAVPVHPQHAIVQRLGRERVHAEQVRAELRRDEKRPSGLYGPIDRRDPHQRSPTREESAA